MLLGDGSVQSEPCLCQLMMSTSINTHQFLVCEKFMVRVSGRMLRRSLVFFVKTTVEFALQFNSLRTDYWLTCYGKSYLSEVEEYPVSNSIQLLGYSRECIFMGKKRNTCL